MSSLKPCNIMSPNESIYSVCRPSLIVVPGGVALLEVLPPGGVEGADGAAQVAVVVRRGQVDLGVIVVGQHPREHRVLFRKKGVEDQFCIIS